MATATATAIFRLYSTETLLVTGTTCERRQPLLEFLSLFPSREAGEMLVWAKIGEMMHAKSTSSAVPVGFSSIRRERDPSDRFVYTSLWQIG